MSGKLTPIELYVCNLLRDVEDRGLTYVEPLTNPRYGEAADRYVFNAQMGIPYEVLRMLWHFETPPESVRAAVGEVCTSLDFDNALQRMIDRGVIRQSWQQATPPRADFKRPTDGAIIRSCMDRRCPPSCTIEVVFRDGELHATDRLPYTGPMIIESWLLRVVDPKYSINPSLPRAVMLPCADREIGVMEPDGGQTAEPVQCLRLNRDRLADLTPQPTPKSESPVMDDPLAPVHESEQRVRAAESLIPRDEVLADPKKAIEYVPQMEEIRKVQTQRLARWEQLDVQGKPNGEAAKARVIAWLKEEQNRWADAHSMVSTRNRAGGPRADFRPYEQGFSFPFRQGRPSVIGQAIKELTEEVFHGPKLPTPPLAPVDIGATIDATVSKAVTAIAAELRNIQAPQPASTPGTPAEAKNETGENIRRPTKLERIAHALSLKQHNPHMLNKDVAKAVGMHPSGLSRSDEYKEVARLARREIRSARSGMRRGRQGRPIDSHPYDE